MKKYSVTYHRRDGSIVADGFTGVLSADCESSFDRREFERVQKLFIAADQNSRISVKKIRMYFHDDSFVEYEDVS